MAQGCRSSAILAVAVETVCPVGWAAVVMLRLLAAWKDHSWTCTVCVHVAQLRHQGKVCFLFFFFFCFHKQAGKPGHLWVYLISNNNMNNVIEPLHVELIKIKSHSSDIHMLRLHRITEQRLRYVCQRCASPPRKVVALFAYKFNVGKKKRRWDSDRIRTCAGSPSVILKTSIVRLVLALFTVSWWHLIVTWTSWLLSK